MFLILLSALATLFPHEVASFSFDMRVCIGLIGTFYTVLTSLGGLLFLSKGKQKKSGSRG